MRVGFKYVVSCSFTDKLINKHADTDIQLSSLHHNFVCKSSVHDKNHNILKNSKLIQNTF